MEDMTDSETSLAWLWVIEAMASYKEVSLSLLHDLVQAAPELPCGLVSNAKERIALRCLEDLFARQSRMTGNAPLAPGSKIGFGLSESCEDVLQQIVQETSASDLKVGGPELAKWDIEPFIRRKSANMPELALEKLSRWILDGAHPHADFLRGKFGLGSVNQEVGVRVNDKNHCSVTSRPNLACSDSEETRVEVISDPLIVENSDEQLKGNLHNGDILPSKRGRSDSAAEDRAGEMETRDGKDDSDVQNNNFKKAKQYASSDSHVVEEDSVPLCGKGPEEDLPERNVSTTVRGLDLAGSEIGTMEEGRVLEEGHNDCTVSNRSHDDNNKELCENESESPRNTPSMPQEATINEPNLHLPTDGSKGVDENLNEPNGSPSFETVLKSSNEEPKSRSDDDFQFQVPNSASHGGPGQKVIAAEPKENTEVCREAETSSDSSGYHNEKTDVANRKNEFLNSQLTDSQDFRIDEPSEQNLCMKCNEAGRALVCGGNNCQLVVHEKCIGSSAAIFDDKGKFYCPFCAYSLAITEYLEAKKRSSLSRKELSAFIQKGPVEHGSKMSIDSLNKKKHCTGGSEDKNFVGTNQLEEIGEKDGNQFASNVNEEHIIVNNQQSELSEMRNINANLECEGKRTSINEVNLRASAGGEVDEEKVVEECPSTRSEGQQNEALGTRDDLSSADASMDFVNQGKEDLGMPPAGVNERDFGAPIQLAHEFNIDSEGNSDGDDDESTVSNYYVRVRKREVHYNTYPAIPQLRRKKVPWTAEEEQKLKEGVQQFSDGRNVQWKKILEFGDCVFLKGRTTVDLKDKWRNMCKGSPKTKII